MKHLAAKNMVMECRGEAATEKIKETSAFQIKIHTTCSRKSRKSAGAPVAMIFVAKPTQMLRAADWKIFFGNSFRNVLQ